MIVIDPRYTDTAADEDSGYLFAPAIYAALVAGIARVLINENLVDQPFLDNYCIGYDEKTLFRRRAPNGHYKAYILGRGETVSPKRRSGRHTRASPPIGLSNWRAR